MTIEQFIAKLEETIGAANPGCISAETKFRELSYWDSLAALEVQNLFDQCFNKQLTIQTLSQCSPIRDIYACSNRAAGCD